MISCYSVLSDFEEIDEILSYNYYLDQGWNAFETINLSSTDSTENINHSEYYDLALEMFNISILSIDDEFQQQNFMGPYYKSYNALGWTYLYYAGEFLEPSNSDIRDSLRNQSVFYFDSALTSLNNSLSEDICSQDWCDTYLGLSYTHYYRGLDNSNYFDSTLFYSDLLINEKPYYNFYHDELNYKNVHYLRGKIYLIKELYNEAYNEIQNSIEDCNPYIDDELNIELLLECFDRFANGNG